MEDIEKTTAAEEAKVGEGEEASTDFTDTSDEISGSATEENAEKKVQSKEQNAEFARKRRESEREAALKDARESAILEALDHKNPFTGEEMKDSVDVEEYLAMKEIEKSGGDPVADYQKHRKEQARKERGEKESAEKAKEAFAKDISSFREKNPDVDIGKLFEDKDFLSYAEGRFGSVPLEKLYGNYRELVGKLTGQKADEEKAAQAIANKKAGVGSLRSSNTADSGFFTPEQVKAMSPSETRKNLDKIMESMKKWK